MKAFLSLIPVFLICFTASAQRIKESDYQKLITFQDSLISRGFAIVNAPVEPERYNANYTFIKTLVDALKVPGSFSFGFDSLKSVSIQPSGDGTFRIFSWPVANNDGSYRYYGTIQMNKPGGALEMYPLVDYSPFIKSPQDTVTTNDKWYGTQYYKVIPVTRNVRIPYYILLGWKGYTPVSTQRVIDILYFKDGKAYFGLPVFDGDKDHPTKQRVIFEYSRQASMMLNYQADKNLIVFDHLAPANPDLKGKFEQYGPDFSYDGLKLINGRWRLMEDIELKNAESETDQQYNDPRKPSKKTGKL